MVTLDEINRLIAATEAELAELESSRSKLLLREAAQSPVFQFRSVEKHFLQEIHLLIY